TEVFHQGEFVLEDRGHVAGDGRAGAEVLAERGHGRVQGRQVRRRPRIVRQLALQLRQVVLHVRELRVQPVGELGGVARVVSQVAGEVVELTLGGRRDRGVGEVRDQGAFGVDQRGQVVADAGAVGDVAGDRRQGVLDVGEVRGDVAGGAAAQGGG